MARAALRLAQNVPGEFFVDETCIDCDQCRKIAPAVFARWDGGEQSFVRAQPDDTAGRLRATMALVTCPTASIGTTTKIDVRPAVEALPEEIAPDVFFCGFAAESSFGASSWLVRRPAGNILVDSPRAAVPLLRRIEALGGVQTLFLTHRDDVADHAKLRARFGCERILHTADVTAGTRDVERQISGHDTIRLDDDALIIPVPGHTKGSAALLIRDQYLFTGDHLWWSGSRGCLHASRDVCWYSWPAQVRSLERLLDHGFTWILPGHGRPFHTPGPGAMRAEIERLLAALTA